jgi:hypothetical protein
MYRLLVSGRSEGGFRNCVVHRRARLRRSTCSGRTHIQVNRCLGSVRRRPHGCCHLPLARRQGHTALIRGSNLGRASRRVPHQQGIPKCGLTRLSTGPPMAGHPGRVAAWFIICLAAKAPRRRRPVNSATRAPPFVKRAEPKVMREARHPASFKLPLPVLAASRCASLMVRKKGCGLEKLQPVINCSQLRLRTLMKDALGGCIR